MSAIDLSAFDDQFSAFYARFAHHFYRVEYRQRGIHYVCAMLNPVASPKQHLDLIATADQQDKQVKPYHQ